MSLEVLNAGIDVSVSETNLFYNVRDLWAMKEANKVDFLFCFVYFYDYQHTKFKHIS